MAAGEAIVLSPAPISKLWKPWISILGNSVYTGAPTPYTPGPSPSLSAPEAHQQKTGDRETKATARRPAENTRGPLPLCQLCAQSPQPRSAEGEADTPKQGTCFITAAGLGTGHKSSRSQTWKRRLQLRPRGTGSQACPRGGDWSVTNGTGPMGQDCWSLQGCQLRNLCMQLRNQVHQDTDPATSREQCHLPGSPHHVARWTRAYSWPSARCHSPGHCSSSSRALQAMRLGHVPVCLF